MDCAILCIQVSDTILANDCCLVGIIVTSEEQLDLSNLPLIPLPEELKNLPSLPKEVEERMRILAKHAVGILFEKYKAGLLKIN